MKRLERDFRKIVEEAGLEVISVVKNCHYKVHVRAPDGRTMNMTMPSSPSDRRWQHNQRTTLRQFADGRIDRVR